MAQDISDQKYRKAAQKPRGKHNSEQITALNVQDQKMKDQEAMKYNYLTATGVLGGSDKDNAKGMGKNAVAGDYGGETSNWGWAMKDSNTFLNFNPTQVQKAQEKESVFTPLVTEMIEEPVYENVPIMGKEPIYEDIPLVDIASKFNFDLGDAGSDKSYDEWLKSMSPEQQKEWDQYVGQLQDPEILEQIGKFQFETGTDATPMSPESQEKWKQRFDEDMDLRAWAYNEGLDLENIDDKMMQRGLGYNRFRTKKKFTEEALRRAKANVQFDDVFDPYGAQSHNLGTRKKYEPERYSKVTNRSKVNSIRRQSGEKDIQLGEEKVRKATRKIHRDKNTKEVISKEEVPYAK